jgi:hypothetical protein
MHRDFHSGNILYDLLDWKIGDLGLSQPVDNKSPNNEIYGLRQLVLLRVSFF